MRNPERFWDRIAKNYDKRSEKKTASLLKTIENIKCHLNSEGRSLLPLVEAEPVEENRNHLFVVAKKV